MSRLTFEDQALRGFSAYSSNAKPPLVLPDPPYNQAKRPKNFKSVVGKDAELMIHVLMGEIIVKDLCDTTRSDILRAQAIKEGKTLSRYYTRNFYRNDELTKQFNEKANFFNPISVDVVNADNITKVVAKYVIDNKEIAYRIKNLEDIFYKRMEKGLSVATNIELQTIYKEFCQKLVESKAKKGVNCKKM